jgi:hypothetical protein
MRLLVHGRILRLLRLLLQRAIEIEEGANGGIYGDLLHAAEETLEPFIKGGWSRGEQTRER